MKTLLHLWRSRRTRTTLVMSLALACSCDAPADEAAGVEWRDGPVAVDESGGIEGEEGESTGDADTEAADTDAPPVNDLCGPGSLNSFWGAYPTDGRPSPPKPCRPPKPDLATLD